MALPQTHAVLAEILTALQDLQQDPKAMKEKIAQMHALSSDTQAKVEAAHKTIADSAQQVITDKKRKDELDEYAKQLDAKRFEIEKMQDKLATMLSALDASRGEFEGRVADHNDDVKAYAAAKKAIEVDLLENAKRKAELDTFEKNLAGRTAGVDAHEQKVLDYEKSLRERAAALRAQTEGLV